MDCQSREEAGHEAEGTQTLFIHQQTYQVCCDSSALGGPWVVCILYYNIILHCVVSYVALPFLSFSFLALFCLALPCLALPCLALPCLVPCLALPCLVMVVLSKVR